MSTAKFIEMERELYSFRQEYVRLERQYEKAKEIIQGSEMMAIQTKEELISTKVVLVDTSIKLKTVAEEADELKIEVDVVKT